MAIAELFLALELLDDVKQRDGIASSDTQKPQDKFVEGSKDFVAGIKKRHLGDVSLCLHGG